MRMTSLGVLLIAMLPMCARAVAQGGGPDGSMTLDVTVSSKTDAAVPGLKESDFKILDNGTARPITSFRALTPPENRTDVILVLDTANVPYQRLSYERQELDKFLTANNGKLAQPTTLAVLTDKGIEMQPELTTDGNALRSSVDAYSVGLRDITRSAGFYGAVERYQLSLKALKLLIDREAPQPERKLIVWLSPGWPLLSGPQVQLTKKQQDSLFSDIVALSTAMREGHIRLDAVNPSGADESVDEMFYYESFTNAVRRARDAQIANLGLQVLALQTGGTVQNSSNDIAGMIERAVDQTKAVYEIAFSPAPGEHENEYHQLQIKVAVPGLTAHTMGNYYARPALSPDATDASDISVSR